ncbi:hypothetical protein CEXT_469081 [Caerostris extrusa]|uniref:Uncharacterized protein n=1 Tax=Caerostris extrusa TaxID=172846 RepID=A0AAV4XQG8_CAEEX|nr:hypothetical protein CEXT_469081 [Caerostris extrusa]
MEVSTEGNGPSEGHLEVPSHLQWKARLKMLKKSPRRKCVGRCVQPLKKWRSLTQLWRVQRGPIFNKTMYKLTRPFFRSGSSSRNGKNVNASISSKVKPVVSSKNVTLGKVNGLHVTLFNTPPPSTKCTSLSTIQLFPVGKESVQDVSLVLPFYEIWTVDDSSPAEEKPFEFLASVPEASVPHPYEISTVDTTFETLVLKTMFFTPELGKTFLSIVFIKTA